MRNGSDTNWCTGQELDGGHAEGLQVGDDGRVGQPGVRAAQVLGDERVQPGEPLDVQLVDDAVAQWHGRGDRARRRRVADHDAQRDGAGGVLGAGHEVRRRDVVEDRAGVVDAPGDRPRVRVQQQLGRVEPFAVGRVPRTVHPVAVALLGADAGDEDVPDAVGRLVHLVVDLGAVRVHERELDAGGTGGPQRERRPAVDDVRAQHGRVAGNGQRDRHRGLLHWHAGLRCSARTPPTAARACSSCLVRWGRVSVRDRCSPEHVSLARQVTRG